MESACRAKFDVVIADGSVMTLCTLSVRKWDKVKVSSLALRLCVCLRIVD